MLGFLYNQPYIVYMKKIYKISFLKVIMLGFFVFLFVFSASIDVSFAKENNEISPASAEDGGSFGSATYKVRKEFSNGSNPKYTLSAYITYETATNKIVSVTNPKLIITSVGTGVSVHDQTYEVTYSGGNKIVTIRCDFVRDIFVSKSGNDYFLKSDEGYMQFSYSVSAGITGKKFGWY